MPLLEVKDLISKAHILITKLTQKNWPDYNYIPDPLNLDHPISCRLDWHYHGSVEETRPFLEDEPGKALHTLTKIFQRVFLQRKTRRMILIREIPSPSAWPFANRKAKSINPFWPAQVHDARNRFQHHDK